MMLAMNAVFKFLTLLICVVSSTCYRKLTSQEISVPEKDRFQKNILDIFQYSGQTPNLFLLWKTVSVNVRFDTVQPPSDFVLYLNRNESQLRLDYDAGQKILGFIHKYSLWKSTKIHPFTSTFVGVETQSNYYISLKVNVVDYFLVLSFIGGIFLFFGAHKLSRNIAAFYLGGSTAGILLSFIFVAFILYRIVPKKSLGASLLVGGSSFTFYLLYSVWHNLYVILERYQRFAAVYVVTIGLVSFALCYRLGPPRHIRSQNLIQWSIQLVALILIYQGCQIQSISATVICIILLIYNIPKKLVHKIYTLKYRYFPPKRRLLTEEEYIYQGMEETRKALDQLREYCRSPKCDTWQLTSRLKSPQRFASFISGGSHLTDDELLNHDSDAFAELPADDDSDEDNSIDQFSYLRPPGGHSRLLQSNGVTDRRHSSGATVNRSNLNNSLLSSSSSAASSSRYVERTAAAAAYDGRSSGYSRFMSPGRRQLSEDEND